MTITTVDPESQGFDTERLGRLESFLKEKYVDTGRLPGVQLLLSRDGEPVHFHTQGSLNEDGSPLAEDTIFRIASMTKPITSTAFMSLFEEGRVQLDTPVARVLPELKDTGVLVSGGFDAPFITRHPEREMQMVDLLRHTAGFTYSFQYRSAVDYAHRVSKLENTHGNFDLDGFVKALGQIPLEFSPGSAWNYSVATDVLGAVVQRVADKPLDEVFKERIFGPLGMDDTGFFAEGDKADRLTDCYAIGPDGKNHAFDKRGSSAWAKKPKLLSGGGGLVSTAEDYHRFCLAYLNGGELDGHRLLSPKTIGLMTSNHLPGGVDLPQISQSLFSETQNDGTGFGLGFAVKLDNHRGLVPGSPGEFSWGGYFSTAFFIDPVERVIMVFMTQVGPSMQFNVRRELTTLIYAAMTESYA
ncbi:serine hydrolase [Pacificimonas flava]|uniref:Serine hydrolase n=2 Tax=Pacificimonas TaxID=1960290 RepID=A0A219B1G6_9SPHN|nr:MULTISPECIES: serine hydrolase domain-containing protein [Pacificimonas]MBZ6378202.1 beta-lactamase family protein [Pacificimonas aurantium]OWV32170.1 serine hydrolase [Pacificimonas flava]